MKSPFYPVIPELIEQPTWGGKYILELKGLDRKEKYKNKLIGQSYELYSGTKLTGIKLADLIKSNPRAILGRSNVIPVIKLTQAKGNSFQLHVKKDTGPWLAKPESWYYLYPGSLTLGVKGGAVIDRYKDCCLQIESGMEDLCKNIKSKKITLDKARIEAEELVKRLNPWQYVNRIKAEKGQIIDLSAGGLHHSWEEDNKNQPLGNIVYELCRDVPDEVSTLRAFDAGKIKDDGTVRPLNIMDYFTYLDRSRAANDPQSHLSKSKILFQDRSIRIEKLLRNDNYCLDKINLSSAFKSTAEFAYGSYHHLFVESGKIVIVNNDNKLELASGHSCFIPAWANEYTVLPQTPSVVLKTFQN